MDCVESIRFNKTSPHKGIVTFTWDDNSETHYRLMAPIFNKYNSKCTFYINPGEEGFKKYHEAGYNMLSAQGFEIGSHGYTHHHFSSLSSTEFEQQLTNARNEIRTMFNRVPTTFAFPHHDFDYAMLQTAKELYLETRNTLHNAKRFSLKTVTNIDSIDEAIINAINKRYTLVFSGHGLINPDVSLVLSGYEPISSEMLSNILDLLSHYQNLQTITFEQAALLSFLRLHCEIKENKVWITDDQLNHLRKFGLGAERIAELL